jgi:Na+/citrate or Na+/malate symporter
MDPATIIADAAAILNIGQMLAALGGEVIPYMTQAYDILTGKTQLTEDQRAANLAQEASLTAQLNATTLPQDAP